MNDVKDQKWLEMTKGKKPMTSASAPASAPGPSKEDIQHEASDSGGKPDILNLENERPATSYEDAINRNTEVNIAFDEDVDSHAAIADGSPESKPSTKEEDKLSSRPQSHHSTKFEDPNGSGTFSITSFQPAFDQLYAADKDKAIDSDSDYAGSVPGNGTSRTQSAASSKMSARSGNSIDTKDSAAVLDDKAAIAKEERGRDKIDYIMKHISKNNAIAEEA
jgi:hypothetical protein